MVKKRIYGAGLFILLFWGLALGSMVGDSPTMDEQNHLTRGYALLQTGDPRLSLEHPPLVNLLSALPLLLLSDLHLDTSSLAWQDGQWYAVAEAFLWQDNQDVIRMIFLARLPILFLTLGLGLVGYRLARQMWGKSAAAFAFIFLLFDPNILAHGHYSTTDLGGTFFLLLAVALLWRMWTRTHSSPLTPQLLFLAAIGLGCAFASKLSLLGFVPIFFIMAVLPLYGEPFSWRGAGRRVGQLTLAGVLSLLVIWAVFAFEWGSYRFRSPDLPWLTALNEHRGPLPTFAAGVEQMVLLGQDSGRPTFLLGETSLNGFAWYFPIAFLVKTPLVTLVGWLAAAFFLLRDGSSRGRALFLLVPPLLFFLLMTQSSLNIGYRHLLPMLPFVYLLIAGLGQNLRFAIYDLRLMVVGRQWLPGGVAVGLVLIALWLYPSYLGFFNLLSGGPANGHNILVDSNLDWGQDLYRLQKWMAQNGIESVKLAWFGTARPDYFGLAYDPLPGLPYYFHLWWAVPFDPINPPDGVYAISATMLWELPLQKDKHVFTWFRQQQPTARVGSSLFIYRVEAGKVVGP